MKKIHCVIGIDEAGRGPLAGPVYVGAVCIPLGVKKFPFPLRDSKRLNEKQRRDIFAWIKNHPLISYTYSYASVRYIDKKGIVKGVHAAAQRCVERINKNPTSTHIITDAGIGLKTYSYKSFPRADESVRAVSLASIVAKEMRDTYMKQLHKKYPQYNFMAHKGYGTKEHESLLHKHGISDVHRLTFTRKFHTLSKT